jgi:hypothetical protein
VIEGLGARLVVVGMRPAITLRETLFIVGAIV